MSNKLAITCIQMYDVCDIIYAFIWGIDHILKSNNEIFFNTFFYRNNTQSM